MIKAVIFDADGMVVTGTRFSDRLARDYAISTDKTVDFFTKAFPDCVLGKADLKEVIIPYLKAWGWKGTLDELLKFWFAGEHLADNRFATVIEKLNAKGIKCYLATNQEKYRLAYFKSEMGLGKIFEEIISSNSIGFKKPSKEFFENIAKVSNCKPEEVQYWDDRPVNIEAGKNFGFEARLYDKYENFEKVISQLIK